MVNNNFYAFYFVFHDSTATSGFDIMLRRGLLISTFDNFVNADDCKFGYRLHVSDKPFEGHFVLRFTFYIRNDEGDLLDQIVKMLEFAKSNGLQLISLAAADDSKL